MKHETGPAQDAAILCFDSDSAFGFRTRDSELAEPRRLRVYRFGRLGPFHYAGGGYPRSRWYAAGLSPEFGRVSDFA